MSPSKPKPRKGASRPLSRPGLRPGAKPTGAGPQGRHPSRIGRPGLPTTFRAAFDQLWQQLFTSPMHLDSALSRAPTAVKGQLATLSRLLLQRPRSLGHYLKFKFQDEEPWGLSPEQLAHWPTARAMANRLLQAYERDAHFHAEGFPVEEDFPPDMIEEWKREYGKKTANELVNALGSPPPSAPAPPAFTAAATRSSPPSTTRAS